MSIAKVKTISDFAEDIIDRIFQLDRLDELSRYSSIVRVAHAEAIMLINYVILSQTEIKLEAFEILGFTISAKTFPPTLKGKLDALALCFGHVAGKLDMALSTQNLARVLSELDFIGDIATAAIPQTRYRYYAKIPSPK